MVFFFDWLTVDIYRCVSIVRIHIQVCIIAIYMDIVSANVKKCVLHICDSTTCLCRDHTTLLYTGFLANTQYDGMTNLLNTG